MDKRTFLKNAALAGLGRMTSFNGIAQAVHSVSAMPVTQFAGDETFWAAIRKGYKL